MTFCQPQSLAFVPLSLVSLLLVTLSISYMIAVMNGDVAKIFPYISDTGGKPPESCIFGQFVNISSLLLLMLIYIRYKEVDTIEGLPPREVATLNKVGSVIGGISAVGLSMVGNFQDTNMVIVHETAAVLLFLCATGFCILHTRITYLLWPENSRLLACRVRLLLSAVMVVSFVICMVSKIPAATQWAKHHNSKDTQLHWKPTDGGYIFHIISTSFEWALAVTFGLFCLSFCAEFQHVSLGLTMFRRSDPFPAIAPDSSDCSNERATPNEYTPLYA